MVWGRSFRAALLGQSEDSSDYCGELLNAVKIFERLNEPYALAGAVASMYYGRARFTEELEFVTSGKLTELLALKLGNSVRFWDDASSKEIIARARQADLEGYSIKIVEPHDLIAMKLRVGRLEDDYDISQIVQNTAIDGSHLQQRVTPEQFQHFLDVKKRK